MGDEFPAVSVPSPLVLSKAGLSAELLRRRVGARIGVTLEFGQLDDQMVEEPAIPPGNGALVALERPRVLRRQGFAFSPAVDREEVSELLWRHAQGVEGVLPLYAEPGRISRAAPLARTGMVLTGTG
jgi:hypothetical protein